MQAFVIVTTAVLFVLVVALLLMSAIAGGLNTEGAFALATAVAAGAWGLWLIGRG